jgi:hypothetical protein
MRGTISRVRKDKLAQKKEDRPRLTNEISDETGQYDMRFLLWRQFCAANNIPVETLPGDLTGETKKRWEELKESRLKKKG